MKTALHIRVFALTLAVIFAQPLSADITVFAAASLRGALDEIAQLSETPVTISYGGSGIIARQVSIGAPADVIILAHPRWMDWLEERAIIDPKNRSNIARNSLVLIGQKDAPSLKNPTDIPARLGRERLAMGQNTAVPAGIYAQEWLENITLWSALKNNLAEVENVRLALALVARGETPLGIVYHTDALAEPRVKTLYTVPHTAHSPITYPAASLTENGIDFISLLQTVNASLIFKSHGFLPAGDRK